jgi:carboxymethylenebutenolidase
MKKILPVILIIVAFAANAQNKMNCCNSQSCTMTAMASDPKFIAVHEAPLAFNYTNQSGKMITFPTPDGKTGSAYEVKSTVPTNNYLVITHEWWGLNDYIKQRADELQKELVKVNVVAIDMYDGNVATTPDDASKFMKEATDDRIKYILRGAITFAGKNAHIYTLGWCFGGGYALQAAILAGKQGDGCVMYYGLPETDVTKLKNLNCEVLGLFADKDQWITPKVVETFKTNMKTADKKLEVKSYHADHAFANPSNPHFDKVAAIDANDAAFKFLKARLE